MNELYLLCTADFEATSPDVDEMRVFDTLDAAKASLGWPIPWWKMVHAEIWRLDLETRTCTPVADLRYQGAGRDFTWSDDVPPQGLTAQEAT